MSFGNTTVTRSNGSVEVAVKEEYNNDNYYYV